MISQYFMLHQSAKTFLLTPNLHLLKPVFPSLCILPVIKKTRIFVLLFFANISTVFSLYLGQYWLGNTLMKTPPNEVDTYQFLHLYKPVLRLLFVGKSLATPVWAINQDLCGTLTTVSYHDGLGRTMPHIP